MTRPRALIPGGITLIAVTVVPAVLTADGKVALTLAAYTTRGRVAVLYLPSGASWSLCVPPALPSQRDEREGLTLDYLGGARFSVEHDGRRSVLQIHSVRLVYELVEALGRYDGMPVELGAA